MTAPLRFILATLLMVIVADNSVDARGGSRCRRIGGDFTSVTIAPPACNSPVGLCTHGTLTGKLRGTYDFVALTLQPAGDPNEPSKFVYTGESIIETRHGIMIGQDTGFLYMNPMGDSPFQTTVHIVSGTEHYESLSTDSFMVATGNLVMATGNAVGEYEGALCRERRCARFHSGDDDHDG